MAGVEEYFAQFPPAVQERLTQIRSLVATEASAAVELMSYGIPTFDQDGEHLIHYAGYARHIGLYPGSQATVDFAAEFSVYKHAKGSVQFPLDQPLPLELIRRVVQSRLAAVAAKSAARKPKRKGTRSATA